MIPACLVHVAALAPSLLQLWWLFYRVTVRQLIYKHTLPILNPTAIVELTSTAQSLKQQLIQLDCFALNFDTIISSSSPAESVARTRRAVLEGAVNTNSLTQFC